MDKLGDIKKGHGKDPLTLERENAILKERIKQLADAIITPRIWEEMCQ